MIGRTDHRRLRVSLTAALASAVLSIGCSSGDAPAAFDDSADNIEWREILLLAGVGDASRRYYPSIRELSLEQSSRVLGACLEWSEACGEAMLGAHGDLRGVALDLAWPRVLARVDPRSVPELLRRGAAADAHAIFEAMHRPGIDRPEPREQRSAVIGFFLAAGAPADVADVGGETLLHLAVLQRDAPLVQLLIAHGADAMRQNRDGISAIQLAQALGTTELIVALQAGSSP